MWQKVEKFKGAEYFRKALYIYIYIYIYIYKYTHTHTHTVLDTQPGPFEILAIQ